MREKLFTPGPTEIPERILRSLSEPVIHHRTEEHQNRLKRVLDGLRRIMMTRGDTVILSSSGTGAMEAVVSSFASVGEAIVVNGGKFGERWGEICEAFGVPFTEIYVDRGKSVCPDRVLEATRKTPSARMVLMTLAETSTGVVHDVKAVGSRLAGWDGMVVVDAISGLVADELRMDDWSIDVVVSGSQKGLMLPPGLGMVALSAKATALLDARDKSSRRGCYYLDLAKYLASLKKEMDVPFTPSITLIRALEESLGLLLAEGMEAVWHRHERVASAVRKACVAMGMTLLASEHPSNALTAALPPADVDATELINRLSKEKRIRIAGGQGEFKGKMLRVAHLGACFEEDVLGVIGAIESCMRELGSAVGAGVGVSAAEEVLAKK